MLNKKIFVFLILGIFMLNFGSSFEFDNVKEYDPINRTIIITNAYGLGDVITTATLISQNNVIVLKGESQLVGWFNFITTEEEVINSFGNLYLEDMKNGKQMSRNQQYKVKIYREESVDDFGWTNCREELIDFQNSTTTQLVCDWEEIGTHLEKVWEWVPITNPNIELYPNIEYEVGIFIDTEDNDYADWKPVLSGKIVDEWATFTVADCGTGGVVSIDGDYCVNVFNSSGTFGLRKDVPLENVTILVIAGGGAGSNEYQWSAGGGAGGYLYETGKEITVNTSVTVGAGATTATIPAQGGNSSFTHSAGTMAAIGGGRGGTHGGDPSTYEDGGIGGSGGGGYAAAGTGAAGTVGQGYAGGGGSTGTSSGGGGGAGGIGGTSTSGAGGTGGVGESNSITGSSVCYAGGGGGGSQGGSQGTATCGGSAAGAGAATANTGGGGGRGGNGGSGIVVIRYPAAQSKVTTTLISPQDNENIFNNTVTFNFTSLPIETNLTNTTLYIWNFTNSLIITNFTTLSGNESVTTTFINTLEDGIYKYNAETCGDVVNCSFSSSNNSFTVHVTPITINILEPTGIIDYIKLGNNQTLSWNLSETGENLTEHVTNCSYTYNSTITYLSINDCIVTNTTEFEYIYGVNNLTFNTTDQFNLTSSQTTTWEYTITEINQTFEENITEGALDDFSLLLNISDSSSLTDATFSYNGTNYTTTIVFSSGLYLISSLIVSPTVDTDTNFSFNFFFVVDDTNYSTVVNQQLVVNSLFGICGGISNDTLLNMSLVDEETGTSISGTIEIIAEIVSQSSDIIVGTINNSFESVEYGAICFTPISAYPLYYLNAEIKYSSDGYVPELYYIQNSNMSDYPRNLTLFDLNQTDSTEFVVTFQNDAFILVEGAIIQLQRKYISENVYKTVEAPITADGGKAIVHIDLNTNIYRASVVKDGELLKFFSDIVFSCDNELAGDCEEQLRGDVDPNNDVPIEDLIDFAYSVSVSDENNTVTTLFAVPSGTPSSINVLLEQRDMFGNITSCNTTVITSAGSITCDFSDTIEKSILQLTISKDGTQLAITNYGVDPELDMDGMNFFIVFLFLISLVGMAIASPEWMMIIGIMVFMISGTLLLLKGMSLAMGLGAMAWLVVAVIIIILKMAKQEDR